MGTTEHGYAKDYGIKREHLAALYILWVIILSIFATAKFSTIVQEKKIELIITKFRFIIFCVKKVPLR